jgi:hypothetical protein
VTTGVPSPRNASGTRQRFVTARPSRTKATKAGSAHQK